VQLGEGYHCIAAFIFSNSSIQTLKFAHAGEKLALGFETGQVNPSALSVQLIHFVATDVDVNTVNRLLIVLLSWSLFQVAMLDMRSLSIMFRTDSLSGGHSPITSIAFHVSPQNNAVITSPKNQNAARPEDSAGVMLILTKDTNCFIIDSINGEIISSQRLQPKKESAAVSMYVIGK